jgi:tripartite-type tricarboxylate transporter receptor subunit TctC
VTSLARSAQLPDVPAAVETVPGMVGELWIAIYAPKGTPQDALARMRAAVAKVLAQPDMEEFTRSQGAEILDIGPADLLALTKTDAQRWGKIISEAGLTVD